MRIKNFLIIAIFITILAIMGNFTHHYSRENCKVISINGNIAQIEDKCGYIWTVQDESLYKGQIVTLKMWDNYTESNIKDDKIIKVKRN